jgi:hypothetical protein
LDQLAGDKAKYVERVLDVRQGELCWVVGTVYMEMALKPNVLDDITKEVHTKLLQLALPRKADSRAALDSCSPDPRDLRKPVRLRRYDA